jgi:2-isopropylmalate synthase
MKDPNYYADLYNSYEKNPKKIRVLDSTLREGEQHPGVSFTNKQRIQIAWMLDYFGVDQIEISPVVSTDHKEAVKTIIKQGLKADIVSHGRALKEDIDVSLSCDAKWCAAYLGISDIHLKDKLRITREQAMERAVGTVEYAKSHGLKIRFTVEDGSRAEPEFLLKMCRAIEEAGVDRISLPDTVGISDAGVDQIHTTIDGIGERTGIPSLAEVSVALTFLYKSPNDFRLDMLQDLSRLIEDYTSIRPYDSKPIVGTSAYKHKAGTHLAAILKNPAAYEPIPPRTVGNRRRIVFGELAGKTGASYLMSILGLEKDNESAKALAAGLKNLRLGDLIEIPLEDRLEKKIINGDKGEKPEEK